MNRRIILIFVFLFLLSCIEVSAQRKQIDNEERTKIEYAAFEKTRTLSRRIKEKSETFASGTVIKLVESLIQVTFDGKRQSIRRTNEEGMIKEGEGISIGDTLYHRDFAGPWKRLELLSWQPSTGETLFRAQIGSQHSIETVISNGLSLQLVDSFFVGNESKVLSYEHRQTWIGLDGLFYRIEVTKGGLSPRTVEYRSVETFEYDPSIKIEAPIK